MSPLDVVKDVGVGLVTRKSLSLCSYALFVSVHYSSWQCSEGPRAVLPRDWWRLVNQGEL